MPIDVQFYPQRVYTKASMDRQLLPRRFAVGSVLIINAALLMTVDIVNTVVMGNPRVLAFLLPWVLGIGWFGVSLLAWGLFLGMRKSRRYGLMVDMNLQINRAILIDEDIDRIYDTVLDYVFMIFPNAKFGSVLTLDDKGYLTFAASKGYTGKYVRNFYLKLEESFLFQESRGAIERALLIRKKTLTRLHTRFYPDTWKFQSVISAPLFVNGQLFGLLNLDSSRANTFAPSDVAIVERLASQIEVCLYARGIYLERLEESREDALTGLLTRRAFEELLTREISRASRYAQRFVLALIDADGLKRVNDSLGHRAGDRFLMTIAQRLKYGNRTSDITGRFGGDEFVVLYHGCDPEAIRQKLDADLAALRSSPVAFEGALIVPSFSYGLARFPEEGVSLDELTDVADRRLYEMKNLRRSVNSNRDKEG